MSDEKKPTLDTEEREVLGLDTINSDEVEEIDAQMAVKYTSAVVPRTDDPTTPAFTVRAVLLGFLFGSILTGFNVVMSFRTVAISISTFAAVLLSYPLGHGLAAVLPDVRFNLFGVENSLNPGPFSMKEHVLIYVMAASSSLPYGMENLITQKGKLWMGQEGMTIWAGMAWIFVSQFVGIGLAGVGRHFLVKPVAMFWPGNLSYVALFVAFHKAEEESKFKMSRYTFYWIWFAIAAVYALIPNYFAPAIQFIPWLCLFGKPGTLLNHLASGTQFKGVGLFALTFDWAYIGSGVLTIPYWAQVVYFVGGCFWIYFLVPFGYYQNWWSAQKIRGIYCPAVGGQPDLAPVGCGVINDPGLYNGTNFKRFRAKAIYNTTTFDLDEKIYKITAPVHLTIMFAFNYAASFASIAGLCTHVFLWYGKDIVIQFRAALKQSSAGEYTDLHNRLMSVYPEVPDVVYLGMFGFCTVLMIIVGAFTAFEMPWWSVLLAIGMGVVFLIPVGTVQAISGTQIGLNVITEFVIGLMIPGKTIAVMCFKSLGYNTMINACLLLSDLKLGHYLHISPVAMFTSQCIGVGITVFLGTGAAWWVLEAFKDLGTGNWQAINHGVFYSAGAIWGAIAPWRFFGPGSVYEFTLWFFPIGLVIPIIPWLGNKIIKSPFWHLCNFSIFCNCWATGIPQSYLFFPFIIGTVSQFYLFKYQQDWWKKYNYVLAAALDSGMAITVMILGISQNVFEVPAPFTTHILNPATTYDWYCNNEGWQGEH